jgi:hypothetical protein
MNRDIAETATLIACHHDSLLKTEDEMRMYEKRLQEARNKASHHRSELRELSLQMIDKIKQAEKAYKFDNVGTLVAQGD